MNIRPQENLPPTVSDSEVRRMVPEDPPDPPEKPDVPQAPAKSAREHIITKADVGRKLEDLAYEIEEGKLPPMSEEQQNMLHQLLFDQGYAEKTFHLPLGFTATFRTFSTQLSATVKRKIREETAQAESEDHKLTSAEFMLLSNRITIAAQLSYLNSKPTWDDEIPFVSEEALAQRVAFVYDGAYDGKGLQAPLLDLLAERINSFNAEIANLISGKYLQSF